MPVLFRLSIDIEGAYAMWRDECRTAVEEGRSRVQHATAQTPADPRGLRSVGLVHGLAPVGVTIESPALRNSESRTLPIDLWIPRGRAMYSEDPRTDA